MENANSERPFAFIYVLKTARARTLGQAIYDREPSAWRENLWTNRNRA